MNPFIYVDSICVGTTDIMTTPDFERAYNPFMVNRALSYHFDTVLLASEMNENPHLPARLQYDYLRSSVRKRKRFAKWHKPEASENLDAAMEFFGLGRRQAEEALSVMTPVQIMDMKQCLCRGGLEE